MGRQIDKEKLNLLETLYKDALKHYDVENEVVELPAFKAEASGTTKSKLAAMTVVANAMLNLDEFIVKG